jgi:hypothetical protein
MGFEGIERRLSLLVGVLTATVLVVVGENRQNLEQRE